MTTETLDALAPYEPVKAAIAKLKKENSTLVFDYESAKGNKLARSHVATLRSMKSEVEAKRVALKADALAFGRKVDAAAKELTAEVEAMIDVHAKPLAEIDAREKAKLASIAMPTILPTDAFACEQLIEAVEAAPIDDTWPASAAKTRENTLVCLRARLDELVASESMAAELAKLRTEKEASERAAKEAAAAAAKAAREENIRKEAIAAAEAKAAKDAAAVKAEAERRAADVKHRVKILHEVADALAGFSAAGSPLDVAEAIAAGKVPHTTITF